MNAFKKTAIGLTMISATSFGVQAQSDNQLAFNDNTGVKTTLIKTDPSDKLDIHDLTAPEIDDDPNGYSARNNKMVIILAGPDRDEVMKEAVASFDRFTNIRVYTAIGKNYNRSAEFILDGDSLLLKGNELWPLKAGSVPKARDYIESQNIKIHGIEVGKPTPSL